MGNQKESYKKSFVRTFGDGRGASMAFLNTSMLTVIGSAISMLGLGGGLLELQKDDGARGPAQSTAAISQYQEEIKRLTTDKEKAVALREAADAIAEANKKLAIAGIENLKSNNDLLAEASRIEGDLKERYNTLVYKVWTNPDVDERAIVPLFKDAGETLGIKDDLAIASSFARECQLVLKDTEGYGPNAKTVGSLGTCTQEKLNDFSGLSLLIGVSTTLSFIFGLPALSRKKIVANVEAAPVAQVVVTPKLVTAKQLKA